jgi:hypothetical protein
MMPALRHTYSDMNGESAQRFHHSSGLRRELKKLTGFFSGRLEDRFDQIVGHRRRLCLSVFEQRISTELDRFSVGIEVIHAFRADLEVLIEPLPGLGGESIGNVTIDEFD